MSSVQVDEAVERANRLVDLFERKMISEALLISELVDVVTPETLPNVLATLPPKVYDLVHHWAQSLPEDVSGQSVPWPLKPELRVSFKEWVREQETHGNGTG